MKFLTIRVLLAAVFFCVGAGSPVFSQTKTSVKILGATVTGRVTVHGKGRSGIFVGLRSKEFGPMRTPARKAETDADGVYRIKDVPPGSYYALPISTSLVFDSNTTNFQGKPLVLLEGETIDGVDFAMVPGAVITGKVTDADGNPVIEEEVFAISADQLNQVRVFLVPMAFQTDDRGIYRIFGLAPGRYKVGIGGSDLDNSGGFGGRMRYQRIYYPNVNETNAEKAKIIELAEGDQATNIDINMPARIPGFAVSGTVVSGETNHPVAAASVGAQRLIGDRESRMSMPVPANQKGQFRIENLPPGTYSLSLSVTGETNLRADPVRFQITDQDVTGLVVHAIAGASLSGIVMLEGSNDARVLARLRSMRVYAWVRGDGLIGGSSAAQPSPISADGSFRITSLSPGIANLQLLSSDYGEQARFVMSRIERDGMLVPREGLEIKPGEQISNIKLIFSYGSGSIKGTINYEKDPPAGSRVLVRLQRDGDTSSALPGAEVDARGRFLIENVQPGTYELVVSLFNPGSRSRPKLTTRSVTVSDGAPTEVVISVDASGIP